MTSLPATDARQKWAQTLDRAHREPVTITQHGRDSVVILDAGLAERALAALEEAEDAAAADAALAELESGEPAVPLEEVAKELGITLG